MTTTPWRLELVVFSNDIVSLIRFPLQFSHSACILSSAHILSVSKWQQTKSCRFLSTMAHLTVMLSVSVCCGDADWTPLTADSLLTGTPIPRINLIFFIVCFTFLLVIIQWMIMAPLLSFPSLGLRAVLNTWNVKPFVCLSVTIQIQLNTCKTKLNIRQGINVYTILFHVLLTWQFELPYRHLRKLYRLSLSCLV